MNIPPWLAPSVAAIGILIAVYLNLRTRKMKAPRYVTQSVTLLGPAGALPEEIQILYRGEQIRKVTRTDIIFWNDGRQSIRNGDVVGPVQVVLPEEIRLLKSKVVRRTAHAVEFETADIPPNRVEFNFKHLGHQDGARIEIFHTGEASSKITMTGTVADAPGGIKRLGGTLPNLYDRLLPFSPWPAGLSPRPQRRLRNLTTIIFLLTGLFALQLGFLHETPKRLEEQFVKSEGIVMVIFGIYCLAMGILGVFGMKRPYPNDLDVE